VNIRDLRDILHEPPDRLRFSDHTCEFREHPDAVACWWLPTRPAEVLTGRPANHAGKVTSRRVKIFDALSEKCVRSAHYTETGLLKSTVKQPGAREE
jgi:hypothetical protein